MAKALETGGRREPDIFVRMFDEAVNWIEKEWTVLGLGFVLPESGVTIRSAVWVDNCFLLAADVQQYKYMARTLSEILYRWYGWHWKDDSLEIIAVNTDCPEAQISVEVDDIIYKYCVVDSMVALGGLLSKTHPDEALLQYRIAKGDKSFYKFRRHLIGKAPVSLKLRAWATRPRATALFLCQTVHWNRTLLMDTVRWERRHLRRVFRMRSAGPAESRMQYNQRTARKLERWYNHCCFKPIHIVILERYHAYMWHERDYGAPAGKIRRERDAQWWETAKALTNSRKRKHEDMTHARGGHHTHVDELMVQATGLDWRSTFDSCATRSDWDRTRMDFVIRACAALGLPPPPASYTRAARNPNEATANDATESYRLEDVPLPLELNRDRLFFNHGAGSVGLEFAVDSQCVAGLANATLAVHNPMYDPCVRRIRNGLAKLYTTGWSYKADYMDPVDWRPREWNAGADYLANYALAEKTSGSTLTPDLLQQMFVTTRADKGAVQVFTDGGYTTTGGAYGIQMVAWSERDGMIHRRVAGYLYAYFPDAHSAFQMEVMALDRAVELMCTFGNLKKGAR